MYRKENLMIGYIYEIVNKINNKKYIGQTLNDINDRWEDHINALNRNDSHNIYLQRSWNKNKEYNFEFNIIIQIEEINESILIQKLNNLEEYYIQKLETMYFQHGYNIRYGGNNSKLSEITKQKISNTLKGKPSAFKGKHFSDESKLKLSNTRKGIKIPEDKTGKLKTRWERFDHPMLNKHHTIETKQKMSEKAKLRTGEKNSFYGKTHTEEVRQKLKDKWHERKMEQLLIKKDLIIEIHLKLITKQYTKKQLSIDYNIPISFINHVDRQDNEYKIIIDMYYKGEFNNE